MTYEELPTSPQVTIRTEFDGCTSSAWDALLAESDADTVFLLSGWLRAWHETLGADAPLLIPMIHLEGRLVAAAAFRPVSGVVEFAGSGPSDYADIVVHRDISPDDAARCIDVMLRAVADITPSFRHFSLRRIPRESAALACIEHEACAFYPTISSLTPAPTMDMTVVDQMLSKKSLKRHDNALQRAGSVDCVTFTHAQDILPRLTPFFDQHVRRWQDTPFPSLFLDPAKRAFYEQVTRRLDETHVLRFTNLHLEGQLAAAHFGFMHAGRYTWYKPTFEPALARLSPGEVLIRRLLQRAKDEQAREFDFTIGDEAFKLRFATRVREIADVHVTPSRATAYVKRLRGAVKRRLFERGA